MTYWVIFVSKIKLNGVCKSHNNARHKIFTLGEGRLDILSRILLRLTRRGELNFVTLKSDTRL